jgi:hypothetical protein
VAKRYDHVGLSLDGAAQNTGHTVFYGNATQLPVGTTTQRPAVPQQGDMRYNSTLGTPEIYNGTAWTNLLYGGGEARNYIVNGGFEVWQRGTSFVNSTTISNFYTADRWGFNRTADVAGTQVSRQLISVLPGARYYLLWARASGDASLATMACYHTLESQDAIALAGKTVTFSVYAVKGANFSAGSLVLSLIYGTGTDQRVYAFTGSTTIAASNNILTNSFTRCSVTGAVPAAATELGITMSWAPTGVAGIADFVGLSQAQLEVGSVATPYIGRLFGEELNLCQRYYEKTFNYATAPAQGVGNQSAGSIFSVASGTTVLAHWAFKASKRGTPTITTYNPVSANANWRNTINTADVAVSVSAIGDNWYHVAGRSGA